MRSECVSAPLHNSTILYGSGGESAQDASCEVKDRRSRIVSAVYGSPKIHRLLRREGYRVNHKRVARSGLRTTPTSGLRRAGSTSWCSLICTCVWSSGGRCLRILRPGSSSKHIFQGQSRRGGAVSPIIHSDRGSQYASLAFRERLAAWECQQSMSRKANCWDNAVTESFFGNLKSEMVHHERFGTRKEAKDKIFDYIEVFYNRSRIHSATDYFAPAEYEARYRAQLKQAA